MQRAWGSSRVNWLALAFFPGSFRQSKSYSDPQDVVGVGGAASAADVLLVAGRVDNNGVLGGA